MLTGHLLGDELTFLILELDIPELLAVFTGNTGRLACLGLGLARNQGGCIELMIETELGTQRQHATKIHVVF